MGDSEYTFAQARARLEDIVAQVRKKDMPLERSLDLLEEGVRLANACTEQLDQSEWRAVAEDLQVDSGVAQETASSEESNGLAGASADESGGHSAGSPAEEAAEETASGSAEKAGESPSDPADEDAGEDG